MSERQIKTAYKKHLVEHSLKKAEAIHKFRKENRKEDGSRYSYTEAARIIDNNKMTYERITEDVGEDLIEFPNGRQLSKEDLLNPPDGSTVLEVVIRAAEYGYLCGTEVKMGDA